MFTSRSSVALTLAALGSGLALSGVSATVLAAGSTSGGLEEVVVTARRASESLQDAPLAVTAITSKTISDFRLQDMTQFASLAPNAYVPKDAYNQNTQISIRGGRYVDPQVEPDFGLYRNGQYYGGPRTNLSSLVDVERVEVLRGPQVALYGRNALNGAVNVVFATPTNQDAAYASAEYGSFGRTDLQGWVNGAMNDTFAVRAAGWWVHQSSGEHYNPVLKQEMDSFHDGGVRLSAKWTPSENVDALWMVETSDSHGPDSTEFVEEPRFVGLLAGYGIGGELPAETKSTILRNTPTSADAQTIYVSQDLNWHTALGTVGLYANYRDYKRDATRDFDETPFAPTDFPGAMQQVNNNHDSVHDTNVEVRWTSPREQRVTWIAGASYLNEGMTVNRRFITSLDLTSLAPIFDLPPGLGVNTATGADDIGIDTKSWSAYGEVTFAATPKLDLILGGRYTDETKDLNFGQYVISDGSLGSYILTLLFASTFPSYSLVDSQNFTNFSPMGEVSYKFSDDVNAYALVSKGFRAGSFNTTATNPAYLPYGSEQGINYEVGMKSMLFDNRMRLNLAAFVFDINDVLLRTLDPVNPAQFSFLQNSGKARTTGVEAELQVHPAEGLDLAATVGWLDAKITEGYSSDQNFTTTPGPGVVCDADTGICKTDISGSPVPGTRDWTAALLANYTHGISDSLRWFANGAFRYQTGGYFAAIPAHPPAGYERQPMDTFNFVDLSTGLETDRWRVILFANNVGDSTPITTRRVNQVDRAQGATYGVRLTARY
jgi:iron complex outermembrane receptor protein